MDKNINMINKNNKNKYEIILKQINLTNNFTRTNIKKNDINDI